MKVRIAKCKMRPSSRPTRTAIARKYQRACEGENIPDMQARDIPRDVQKCATESTKCWL